ncbi:MAG: bifunctional riboflavin kinase/FAD synthetase [Tychonema bourrellyi B0820]|uniref:Bifunctional riboflavin kinase/FMN adenylyltransferase n=1 Tax=Tychonema bourrellyi FEM_GT703 TaxID=2040638 RepID=A0A2G4F3S7_9CYAN|nr:bifunctional riboflavin kinase/FAD synthetase [Tychonema bourrellyi]MDQ2096857.1 bifunctional riboflavin kinase/FAD synthetase [Tychonema bourrellyi B0820]PHX56381.1 bifunctional riboflavin kinase/FAD synthetase [Tychonema bourrellyi FEM_GT703]
MWITSSFTAALTPTAVALGNFDGLHLGHRQVVEPILNRSILENSGAISSSISVLQSELQTVTAKDVGWSVTQTSDKELKSWDSNGAVKLYGTVVTFNPHPQEFFSGQSKKLLTPLAEKVELLEAMGVEQLILLPFDRELAALTAPQFVEEILVRQLQASRISVGMDFRFGQGRAGTAVDLQAIASNYGIDVTLVGLHTCGEGERISSSVIRESLACGDLRRANQLLGRCYNLVGQIVQGQQLGRTIGFPTANIELPPSKFLPRFGVYAVRVLVKNGGGMIKDESSSYEWENPKSLMPGQTSDLSLINGVMNVGCRPTVDGQEPTVEVHLLDWSGDLYGQTLSVSLVEFLRPEQKFASLEALKTQIQADCDVARSVLGHRASGIGHRA